MSHDSVACTLGAEIESSRPLLLLFVGAVGFLRRLLRDHDLAGIPARVRRPFLWNTLKHTRTHASARGCLLILEWKLLRILCPAEPTVHLGGLFRVGQSSLVGRIWFLGTVSKVSLLIPRYACSVSRYSYFRPYNPRYASAWAAANCTLVTSDVQAQWFYPVAGRAFLPACLALSSHRHACMFNLPCPSVFEFERQRLLLLARSYRSQSGYVPEPIRCFGDNAVSLQACGLLVQCHRPERNCAVRPSDALYELLTRTAVFAPRFALLIMIDNHDRDLSPSTAQNRQPGSVPVSISRWRRGGLAGVQVSVTRIESNRTLLRNLPSR